MATEKHGVELTLKSNLDAALAKAGKAAATTRVAVNGVGGAAGAAFSKAGAAVVVFNQGLELAKKGMEVFRATIGASIATSLEFRKKGDEMVGFFKDFDRETKLVSARIGDALLPVFRGFIEAAQEASGKVSDLIAENQKLIGSTLIEWIGKVATLLVTGVARAVELVGKVFLGWKIIIAGVQIAVNEFLKTVTSDLWHLMDMAARAAESLGAKGMAKSIRDAQGTIAGISQEFARSSDVAKKELDDAAASVGQFDSKLAKIEKTVKAVIQDGMVRAQKHVAAATKGTTKTIEEQTAALEKQKAAVELLAGKVDKLRDARMAAIEAGAARFEADARAIDAQQQAAAAEPTFAGEAGAMVAGAAGGAGGVAMGFATGGPAGGALAFLGEAINNSEAVQRTFEKLNDVFGKLLQALEPLFVALEPMIVMLGEALLPVIEQLGEVLKTVAYVILNIVRALSEAWNGIVGAVVAILRKLGSIEIFGKRPLGFMQEWADGVERRAMISTDKLDDALDRVRRGHEDSADAIQDGANTVRETVDQMARQFVGIPGILKVALHEYRAADPARAGAAATPAHYRDRAGGLASGTTINAQNIVFQGLDDPGKTWNHVVDRARIEGVQDNGVMSGRTTQEQTIASVFAGWKR